MAGDALGSENAPASSTIGIDSSQLDQITGEGDSNEGQQQGTEQQGQPQNVQEDKPFFDATKVRPELEPSYREMQAAWTKKTQALGDLNRTIEDLGGLEEVTPFLEQFTSTEGTLQWFGAIAEQLGPEGVMDVLEQAGIDVGGGYQQEYQQDYGNQDYGDEAQPQGYEDDFNQPLTRAEFFQMQQEQQMQQQAAQEDGEVRQIMDKLEIPDDVRDVVAQIASRQPEYLGYHKRLERGFQQFQQLVEQQSASILEKRQSNEGRLPKGGPITGGSAPATGGDNPESMRDAMKGARAYLDKM